MANYEAEARHALTEAHAAIEEVGSLRQDEFTFWFHLVEALVMALLATSRPSADWSTTPTK